MNYIWFIYGIYKTKIRTKDEGKAEEHTKSD